MQPDKEKGALWGTIFADFSEPFGAHVREGLWNDHGETDGENLGPLIGEVANALELVCA